MRRFVDKKLNLIKDKSLHDEIMSDIDTLQVSHDKKTFVVSKKLFFFN